MLSYHLNKYITKRRNIGYQDFDRVLGFCKNNLDSVKKYQVEKINSLLEKARLESVFFSNYPSKIHSLTEFQNLPILNKAILKESFENILSSNKEAYDFIMNSSGGSTGVPTTVAQDINYRISESESLLLVNNWRGIGPFDSMIKLWGAERDTYEGKKSLFMKIRDFSRNRIILNCFSMDESDYQLYIDKINRFKPKLIYSYANSLYELSQYINRNNIQMHVPLALHTGAGPMFEHMRKEIEKAFNSKVFNHYGCREVGSIASECSAHSGLHIISNHNFVEVVDDKGKWVKEGQVGRVIVTNLHNHVFPLIRYEIGDLAVYQGKEKCKCGVSYPKISSVEGRTTETIDINGRKIQAEFFIHTLGVVLNSGQIKKFQVRHLKKLKQIKVLLVTDVELSKEFLNEVTIKILSAIKGEYDISFEFPADIEKNSTGKHVYIVNE
ncbi:hypothetical protein KW529_17225 [Vibrio fluvialis]|nr:hypothetical protein [Vibrio fluvialis]